MKEVKSSDLKHYVRAMSSLEIAGLTGKQHKDVIRDIRVMLSVYQAENLVGADLRLLIESSTYKSVQGISKPCYNLDKEATIVLMMGYSIVLRIKVTRRWLELEEENARLILERGTTKKEFSKLTNTIQDIYIPAQTSEGAKTHAYANLAELVNKWATGYIARCYKKAYGIDAKAKDMRNYMTEPELKLITEGEQHIYGFIRYAKITNYDALREALFNEPRN